VSLDELGLLTNSSRAASFRLPRAAPSRRGHDAWAVRPVAEAFVERERDVPATISGLVGAIWRAADRLSFDAAVRLARAGDVSTTELRVGLTWGFCVRP